MLDLIVYRYLKFFVVFEIFQVDMGFGPQIEKCMSNPSMPHNTEYNTLIFSSATFPQNVQQKAIDYLKKVGYYPERGQKSYLFVDLW